MHQTREGERAGLASAEPLLQKARALAPRLRERAEATGKARRVPDETIQDFWDAGLWYLLKPKKFGGPEHRPDVALSVANELSRADGSAGWVWAVMTIHDLLVALWPEEFQHEYWAKNTLSASSFAPTGKASPANGGYKHLRQVDVQQRHRQCRLAVARRVLRSAQRRLADPRHPLRDAAEGRLPGDRRLVRVRPARHRQQGRRGRRRVRAEPSHRRASAR